METLYLIEIMLITTQELSSDLLKQKIHCPIYKNSPLLPILSHTIQVYNTPS
jgi:hypothetical protein